MSAILESLDRAESELATVVGLVRGAQQSEHAQSAITLIEQARTHVRRLAGTVSVAPPVPAFTFGGPPIRKGIDRDPAKLLPPFAAKVERLFGAMRERGHEAILWEGYRSAERAQQLSDRGSGIKLSMHVLGAAVDIIHAEDYWQASDDFWDALGDESEELGLTWGGRWKRRDLPHVQAVAVKDQERFRRMTEQERIAFLTGGAVYPPASSSSG